jgi:sporulation protein YlmC with PRC-barrel domain
MDNADTNVYTHLEVIDRGGQKVGTVSDVVSDTATLEPRWLVVDIGMMKTSHYLPVEAVQRNDDGQLIIPFDKETVKAATKPNKGHVLTAEDDRELREHYRMLEN